MIATLVVMALLAPVIAPHDPTEISLRDALLAPSVDHPLGTDQLGRDVLSRLIYGSRISLTVGLIAVGIALIIGLLIGGVAGWLGGWIDTSLMRLVDLMLCIPTFFLILSVIALIGPNIVNICIVIGLTGWMGVARLIRAEILSLKERDFILAERALGSSPMRILLRHLLPNAMGPVMVNAVLGVAGAILLESSLSFLGIGVQPPTPSWGNMLLEAKETLGYAWWLSLYPGLAIFLAIMGYNLMGEGIQQLIDPRRRIIRK